MAAMNVGGGSALPMAASLGGSGLSSGLLSNINPSHLLLGKMGLDMMSSGKSSPQNAVVSAPAIPQSRQFQPATMRPVGRI
jgi:hypothetical protein